MFTLKWTKTKRIFKMSNTITIPTSEADLKLIKDGIQELVDSLIRVESEKDLQKEILTSLVEDTGIARKHLNRMARDSFRNQFNDKVAEFDAYTALYEAVMQS